jgi:hypothetical protein
MFRKNIVMACLLLLCVWAHGQSNVALIVAISDYQHYPQLQTPVNDGGRLAKILREQYGYKVETLFNQQATRSQIIKALRDLRSNTQKTRAEQVIVYYTGHGTDEADEGYWIPYDAEDVGGYIANSEVQGAIQKIQCRQLLLVSDSCFSGQLLTKRIQAGGPEEDKLPVRPRDKELASSLPVKLVLTSGGKEPVLDKTPGSLGHSVFAVKFLDILDRNRGEVRIGDERSELYQAILGYVTINAKQTPQVGFLKDSGSDRGSFVFKYTERRSQYLPANFVGEWDSNYGLLTLTVQGDTRKGSYEGGKIVNWKIEGDALRYSFSEGDEAGTGEFKIVEKNRLFGGHSGHEEWQVQPKGRLTIPTFSAGLALVGKDKNKVAVNEGVVLLGKDEVEVTITGTVEASQLQKITATCAGREFAAKTKADNAKVRFLVKVAAPMGRKERIRVTAHYEAGKSHRILMVNRLQSLDIMPPEMQLEPGQSYTFRCQGQDLDGRLQDLKLTWGPDSCVNQQGVFQSNVPGDYTIWAQPQGIEMQAQAKVTVKTQAVSVPTVNRDEATRKYGLRCFKDAEEAYRAGRHQEALADYQEAENSGVQTLALYQHRAESYEALGKWVEAITDHQSVLRLCALQDKARTHMSLAKVYEKLSQWQQAADAYREARTLDSRSQDAWEKEVLLELTYGDLSRAKEAVAASLRIRETGMMWYCQGQIWQREEKWSEAKSAYEKSLTLDAKLAAQIRPRLSEVEAELSRIRQERLDAEKQQLVAKLSLYYGSRGELRLSVSDLSDEIERITKLEQELSVLRFVPQGEIRSRELASQASDLQQRVRQQDTRYRECVEGSVSEEMNQQLQQLVSSVEQDSASVRETLSQAKKLYQEMSEAKETARSARTLEEKQRQERLEQERLATLKRQQEQAAEAKQRGAEEAERRKREAAEAARLAAEREQQAKIGQTSEDGRYRKYASGVILDTKTNLEWFVGPDKDTTWDEAKSWTDSLTVDGGDWRIPKTEELRVLYQPGKGSRNLDPIFGTTGWCVWSADEGKTSFALYFYFHLGREGRTYRNLSRGTRVFAVRARRHELKERQQQEQLEQEQLAALKRQQEEAEAKWRETEESKQKKREAAEAARLAAEAMQRAETKKQQEVEQQRLSALKRQQEQLQKELEGHCQDVLACIRQNDYAEALKILEKALLGQSPQNFLLIARMQKDIKEIQIQESLKKNDVFKWYQYLQSNTKFEKFFKAEFSSFFTQPLNDSTIQGIRTRLDKIGDYKVDSLEKHTIQRCLYAWFGSNDNELQKNTKTAKRTISLDKIVYRNGKSEEGKILEETTEYIKIEVQEKTVKGVITVKKREIETREKIDRLDPEEEKAKEKLKKLVLSLKKKEYWEARDCLDYFHKEGKDTLVAEDIETQRSIIWNTMPELLIYFAVPFLPSLDKFFGELKFCGNCQGKRKIPCFTCKGLGSPPCPNCNGEGKITSTNVKTSARCPKCYGDGKIQVKRVDTAGTKTYSWITCPVCDGTRYTEQDIQKTINCPSCQGKGRQSYQKCFNCQAKGKIVCDVCQGTGLQSSYQHNTLDNDGQEAEHERPADLKRQQKQAAQWAETSEDGRYKKSREGVILDTKTNLEWYVGPDQGTTWDEAKSWTDSLAVDGGGWRMPTFEELRGLYQQGKGSRNMEPLFVTSGCYMWSCEEKNGSSARRFNFAYGGDDGSGGLSYYGALRGCAVRARRN